MQMAYRKTALVHAKGQAKKEAIIAATIDMIARVGADKVTTNDVAERAGISAGSLYSYFPDKTEMIATATSLVLAQHLAAMQISKPISGPHLLAEALFALYARFEQPRLVLAMFDSPLYCEGIRDELAGLLRRGADMSPKDRKAATVVILGILRAVYAAFGAGKRPAETAIAFSLRSMGISNAQIDRLIA